jgi:hypothetical protein
MPLFPFAAIATAERLAEPFLSLDINDQEDKRQEQKINRVHRRFDGTGCLVYQINRIILIIFI